MSWLQLLHPRVVHGFSRHHCGTLDSTVEAVSTITPAPAPTKTFELSYKQYRRLRRRIDDLERTSTPHLEEDLLED